MGLKALKSKIPAETLLRPPNLDFPDEAIRLTTMARLDIGGDGDLFNNEAVKTMLGDLNKDDQAFVTGINRGEIGTTLAHQEA